MKRAPYKLECDPNDGLAHTACHPLRTRVLTHENEPPMRTDPSRTGQMPQYIGSVSPFCLSFEHGSVSAVSLAQSHSIARNPYYHSDTQLTHSFTDAIQTYFSTYIPKFSTLFQFFFLFIDFPGSILQKMGQPFLDLKKEILKNKCKIQYKFISKILQYINNIPLIRNKHIKKLKNQII